MADACMLARQRLTQYVASLKTPANTQKVGAAWKAGFIGSIVTPAKALGGNASWAGFRILAGQPVEAGLDYIQSVGKAARTGFKASPNEFREVVNGTDWRGLGIYGTGFKEGTKNTVNAVTSSVRKARALPPGTKFGDRIAEAMDELRVQMASYEGGNAIESETLVRFSSPIGKLLGEGAFAAADAVDRPYLRAAHDMSVYMQAKLAAVKQGLKGAEREAEITRLLKNPGDEIQWRATEDALYATFKDKGALLREAAQRLRKMVDQAMEAEPKGPGRAPEQAAQRRRFGGHIGSLLLDSQAPFTGVPTNVMGKMASVSPLGVLSPRMLAGGQSGRSLAGSNAILGTAGMMLGYQLAKDGTLTGAASNSANQRADEIMTAGRTPYSLLVGDTWVDLRPLGPAASFLFLGANLASAHQKNPDMGVLETTGSLAAGVGRQSIDNAYLKNVGQAIDAIRDPERKGSSVAGSALPIPALLGQAGRALDDRERDAQTTGQKLMARTPLRLLLPERRNSMGEVEMRSPGERAAALLSPFQVSKNTDTPVLKELRRVGVSIGKPERTTQIKGQRVEVPQDAYDDLVRRQGDGLDARLQSVIDSPEYAQKNDEQRAKWLKRVIQHQRDRARAPIRRGLITGNTP